MQSSVKASFGAAIRADLKWVIEDWEALDFLYQPAPVTDGGAVMLSRARIALRMNIRACVDRIAALGGLPMLRWPDGAVGE